MAISLGIFGVILGFILLLLGIIKLAASKEFGVAILTASLLLIVGGIWGLSYGQGGGNFGLATGIAFLLVGFLLVLIGCWTSVWGPVASRNSSFGFKFLFAGLAFVVVAILIITFPTGSTPIRLAPNLWSLDFSYIMSRRIGPMPFGLFALTALLGVNGVGLRRGLNSKQLVGANVVILACLVVLYALGPNLFRTW